MTGRLFSAFRDRDLRVFISALALIMLAVYFWAGSRYPALNEKALTGGDTPLSGLSFDIVLDIFPNSPIWWEIIANMANWIFTNLKGMTFGVLFGAAMLTMLSVVKKRSFNNGFANAALGAVIGAPLGVCVNCAAPIALGLHMGRMRLETTLAALVASPTLNVIVVTMSFALLPVHVAATKLLLSLVLVLLIIPLLCKYWLTEETAASASNIANLSKVSEPKGLTSWIARALAPREHQVQKGGLAGGLIWYIQVFLRNLFYIAIITVPMMFVAAFLGALIASIFDSSALQHLLPQRSASLILLSMVILAAIATFAPAPIALDIILTAVLLGIGLRTDYATVVLIGLGSFSIYAFIILWRAISLKTAFTLWVVVMGLATTGGVIAKLTASYEAAYYEERAERYLLNAPALVLPDVPSLPSAPDFSGLRKQIAAQKLSQYNVAADIVSDRNSIVSVSGFTDNPNMGAARIPAVAPEPSTNFTRVPGQELGLDEEGVVHPLREMAPAMFLGGIAAGDVHGDGWIDVVTRRPTGATGLSLYTNINGRFRRQDLAIGAVMESVVINIALADLDNDGQLDLIAATQRDGVFIFYNQGGFFEEANSTRLTGEPFGLAMALAFADMDSDGYLDIIIGRWADGTGREGWGNRTTDIARNQIAWNIDGRKFEVADIAGSSGQTLTTLVSDFDSDGRLDLLKGDDVAMTDQVISFADGRKTRQVVGKSQPFPYFMRTSMSYDVGDWNNDLRRDYYGAQIANDHDLDRSATIGDGRILEICQQFGRDNGWTIGKIRNCAIDLKSIDQIRGGKSSTALEQCGATQRRVDTTLCFAQRYQNLLFKKVHRDGKMAPATAAQKCRRAYTNVPAFLSLCDAFFLPTSSQPNRKELLRQHASGVSGRNILMTKSADGSYVDQADEHGVAFPGWSWNSRFADLDQNGWQDLLVMTGIWLSPSRSSTNVFLHNDGGRFTDATQKFGFTDVVPSYSYVSFDYDRDGDIDIVRDASATRVIVHRNDRPAGKAIWVHLRDKKSNSMGVGATIFICTNGAVKVERGKCQMRDIKASGGFQSFDPIAAHFGLGKSNVVSFVQVKWQDGEMSNIQPESGWTQGEFVISRN